MRYKNSPCKSRCLRIIDLPGLFFSLTYFNSKKQGELDFVLEVEDAVLTIEVKSGKDYQRHVALDNVLASPNYHIPEAVVLCNDNVKVDGKITYLPIYMTMFL